MPRSVRGTLVTW
ncbi:unnamed protein product [Kuraishia capsulata CBS 1993]|uniref:Uncharacterized protein n=1 Tax=Kuraishia capsulata CBS 1993 TaxID=1382522 RepID=W6MID5_9ASCO|nr:unnamed protein product [Kuraishia capsulata CBS 1993]